MCVCVWCLELLEIRGPGEKKPCPGDGDPTSLPNKVAILGGPWAHHRPGTPDPQTTHAPLRPHQTSNQIQYSPCQPLGVHLPRPGPPPLQPLSCYTSAPPGGPPAIPGLDTWIWGLETIFEAHGSCQVYTPIHLCTELGSGRKAIWKNWLYSTYLRVAPETPVTCQGHHGKS